VQGYRFTKSSGAIVAIWSTSRTQHVDLTTLGTVTSVTDQYGASVTSSLSDFPLDFRVVYVRVR
jgi:hypothetical protein